MAYFLNKILYDDFGDYMKKFIPYLCSIVVGTIFGFILFQDNSFNIQNVFAENLKVTAFQLGVFNNKAAAITLSNKHDGSIVKQDGDVYRVYYSFLTNNEVITKMEKYLTEKKIHYYLIEITIRDPSLIKAINEFEPSMIEGSESVLVSINKLITSSYQGSGT